MAPVFLSQIKRLKVQVLIFGVLGRGGEFTIASIEKNILKPLQEIADVTVSVINNIVDTIDEVAVNDGTHHLTFDCDMFTLKQEEIDHKLQEKKPGPWFRSNYTDQNSWNALRQMYIEFVAGKHIADVDVVVAVTADAYHMTPISLPDVRAASLGTFFTTPNNPGQGLTNGYYIGRPREMRLVMNRYDTFTKTDKDYEYVLLEAVKAHSVVNKTTKAVFVKVRANGKLSPPSFIWKQRQHNAALNEQYFQLLSMVTRQSDPTSGKSSTLGVQGREISRHA